MRFIANILWFILGGFLVALVYFIVGLLLCITIVGIPFGVQLFNGPNEPGCLSTVMNLLWILLGWWEIAAIHLAFGLICCITIIGIPWGLQHFKMAIGAIFPFGKQIN